MQKIATKVFITASMIFGLLGIIMVLTSPEQGVSSTGFNRLIEKLIMITVFIILPSFALSVASKYLNGKK